MSGPEEQKKDDVGVNLENDKSEEVSTTTPETPVAGGSGESKDTEEAGECSSPQLLPESNPNENNKDSVATCVERNDETPQPQLKRKYNSAVDNAGEVTKTFIIEISDDDSDSDSSWEPWPPSNGPQNYQKNN